MQHNKPHEAARTQYLGKHKIISRQTTTKNLLDSEQFHIFKNNYSFLDMETKFGQWGGVDGATTLYLFRENQANTEEEESTPNSATATNGSQTTQQ